MERGHRWIGGTYLDRQRGVCARACYDKRSSERIDLVKIKRHFEGLWKGTLGEGISEEGIVSRLHGQN